MAEEKLLIVTPEQYSVGRLNTEKAVALRFYVRELPALPQSLDLVIRMAPEEARDLAALLLKKADEVESGPTLPLQ